MLQPKESNSSLLPAAQQPSSMPSASNEPISPVDAPSEKPLRDWTHEEVLMWLNNSLKLPQYQPVFQELSLDGEMLENITEEDLKNDL